jgi:ATP-dependent DNA helicase RecG
MLDLSAPVQFVKGIGPERASALVREGLATAEDLLFRLPMRYEDRRLRTRISDLRPGMRTAVSGRIAVAGLRRTRRMPIYEVLLQDDGGRLRALWFNQPYLREVLPRGSDVILYGEVRREGGVLVMTSPQFEKLEVDDGGGIHTGRVVPVYEKTGPLTGRMLRRILFHLAAQVPDDVPDPLPAGVRERLGVIGRGAALRGVHVPGGEDSLDALNAFRSPAHVRLIQEELFLFQLGLALRKQGRQSRGKGIAFEVTDRTREAVKRILPFRLTEAQKRVLREIADDMRSPHPMNRLVQGDVGSGKTIVALLAMVIALENGYQAAFMAPTEILAEQHFLNFKRLLERCPYPVELLSATALGPRRKRTGTLERLASGECRIAVGTHALIQENVAFARLGLAVVDEQHRFGVRQRAALDAKARGGLAPHLLHLTATPIPRTLSLTLYGDLDTTTLRELPAGRRPVKTWVVPEHKRAGAYDFIRERLREGRQCFVVCPLVEESEALQARAATVEGERLARGELRDFEVAVMHGQMHAREKRAVMARFAAGEVDVLVATSVIEVGIDVPNASVMVIEEADRYGISQLHQLRGRVGRGTHESYCLLFSDARSELARHRLEAVAAERDGFRLAEVDLTLRGEGDVLGTRQHGLPEFRVARLPEDAELLELARAESVAMLAADPELVLPQHALLRIVLERRFGALEVEPLAA